MLFVLCAYLIFFATEREDIFVKQPGSKLRFIRQFMNFSLAKKMLFLYLLIVFFPVVIFSTVYLSSMVEELNHQYRESRESLLQQASQSIQNNLSQIEFCTGSLQASSSIREYVEDKDLSDGDGVYLYLTGVQSTFEQLRGSNPFFESIRVYRATPREMNDPYNVLNQEDSPYLTNLEQPLNATGLTLVLDLSQEESKCVVLKYLYSDKYYRQIGTTEIVCDADYLFSPLHFVEENEYLLLQIGDSVYRIAHSAKGTDQLMLSIFSGEPEACPNVAHSTLEEVNARISYWYPDIHVSFHQSFWTTLAMVVAILAFFSLIYYFIYLSITKRITGLTHHIIAMSPESPVPYQKDQPLYRDEIGELTYHFNEMVEQIDFLINQSFRQEKLVQQAQYYAMESQITPHFLYNTLESINMLIQLEEYEKASEMLLLFSKFLRYNVSWKTEETTLKNELDHVRDYLELYSCRMGERFHYQIHISENCAEARCPYFMLQPLVENSFKHGFRNSVGNLLLVIRVFSQKSDILIQIEDNGQGISEEERQLLNRTLIDGKDAPGTVRVGLHNVNSRIKLLFGQQYGVTILKTETGCCIQIRIPQNHSKEPM